MSRSLLRRLLSPLFAFYVSLLSCLAASTSFAVSVCPQGMAPVTTFCIDRWEAHLVDQSPYEVPTSGVAATAAGVVPQGYISGDVASAACAAAGKRLCTSSEWLQACRGPGDSIYPYGDTYQPDTCNDTRPVHPIIELFGADATFSSAQLNDPQLNQLADSVDPTGANGACQSEYGVWDMHGNLDEWVSDVGGTFRGGNYVEASINGAGCLYATTAHTLPYHDYRTGFRCCSDDIQANVPVSSDRGWLVLAVLLATTGAIMWRTQLANEQS